MNETKNEENKFENIKTEELEKKLKPKKFLNKLIIGFWIVSFILYAYFGLIKDYEINDVLIIIWCSSIILMIFNSVTLDEIKKELNTRKKEQSS